MISSKSNAAILGTAISTVLLTTMPSFADDGIKSSREAIARDRRIVEAKRMINPDLGDDSFINVSVCDGTFTVYKVDAVVGGGHLEVGHKFDIKGPLPWMGVYRVKPIPSESGTDEAHPWAAQPYFAFPEGGVPGWSRINDVVVAPHYKEESRIHVYNMEVEDWDEHDCPTKINFVSREHATGSSGSGGLHPGHASTGKD